MNKNIIDFLASLVRIFFVLPEAGGSTFDYSLFDQILKE